MCIINGCFNAFKMFLSVSCEIKCTYSPMTIRIYHFKDLGYQCRNQQIICILFLHHYDSCQNGN